MCETCEERPAMVEFSFTNEDGVEVLLRACLGCARERVGA